MLARIWYVHPSAFEAVCSAGLIGIMVGQLVVAPLADRFGRKLIILASMTVFGLLSLATAFANDIATLLILRFIGGIGLGGVTSHLIASGAEPLIRWQMVVLDLNNLDILAYNNSDIARKVSW